jgi:hypothetical protein
MTYDVRGIRKPTSTLEPWVCLYYGSWSLLCTLIKLNQRVCAPSCLYLCVTKHLNAAVAGDICRELEQKYGQEEPNTGKHYCYFRASRGRTQCRVARITSSTSQTETTRSPREGTTTGTPHVPLHWRLFTNLSIQSLKLKAQTRSAGYDIYIDFNTQRFTVRNLLQKRNLYGKADTLTLHACFLYRQKWESRSHGLYVVVSHCTVLSALLYMS